MLRPTKFISASLQQRDWFALFLSVAGIVIACWIVSTVFLSSTRRRAMERFQLATPSFAQWAVMAPVPAMYNYENRIQFTNQWIDESEFDQEHKSWFACPVNHFPARCITFGEFSPMFFGDEKHGTFEMSTRFRESELISRWEIQEQSDGSLKVRRYLENWVQHNAGE